MAATDMAEQHRPATGQVAELVRDTPIHFRGGKNYQPAYFLLQSDVHIGAAEVRYKLLREDLKWAREHNARILIIGDLFDAIFPKDPRFTPTTLDKRLVGSDTPMNTAIDIAVDEYADYADLLHMIGYGNHETGIIKHNGADMLAMFHERIQAAAPKGHTVYRTGYTGGYVVPMAIKNPGGKTSKHASFRIWFHHGFSGDARVTKGLIAFNRAATFVSGAHVMWMGHLHKRVLVKFENPA